MERWLWSTAAKNWGWSGDEPGRKDRREVEIHLTAEGDKMVTRVARLHRDELLTMQGLFQVPGEREFLDEKPES